MDVNNQSRIDKYWVDSPNLYDRNLNFAAIASEDDEYGNSYSKTGNKKTSRDPQSHRIIEKRRRDRMNNCLADLSRLLPAVYMKKSRGRIEKTEIIEMTIKHMKHLQIHACKDIDTCDIAARMETDVTKSEHYRSGFVECINEAVQFIGLNHQSMQEIKLLLINRPRDQAETAMRLALRTERRETQPHRHPYTQTIHRATTMITIPATAAVPVILILPRTKSCSSSSCGSQAGAVHHNGNNQDQDSMNAMYSLKFKTNIQQRFTAHNMDHEFPSMSTASAMMTPTSMNSASNSDQQQQQEQQQHSYEKVHSFKRKKISQVDEPNFNWHHGHGHGREEPLPPPSPPLSRTSSSNRHSNVGSQSGTSSEMDTSSIDTQNKDQQAVVAVGQTQGEFNKVPINKQEKVENVPIFALHPKGSFYVPMSVELPLIGAMFNMELSPTPLLHPVTISVNFCHPLRVLSAPQAPVIEFLYNLRCVVNIKSSVHNHVNTLSTTHTAAMEVLLF
nr:EOG090X0J7Y [Eubosmina coregoni]